VDKTKRKRLSQAEIDSLVQETASKVVPRTAATATATATLPKPTKSVGASPEPPAPIRPLTAALDESLASMQATVLRLDERLSKAERSFGGFEKQMNAVETSLVAEREARDEQAKVLGEMRAVAQETQGDALQARLADLTERVEKSEQALNDLMKQTSDILASLTADREAREEQARVMSEMKTAVEGLRDQSAKTEVAGLTDRLANVETATDKSEEYRKAFETALMANRQLQLAQSQAVNTQLKAITQGLRNTLAYDIKRNFKCDCCGADGAVALKIRCTHCEKENWWGWWPKEKE
jgi:predicted  nucleic acid-binding Zn-ribbon protein